MPNGYQESIQRGLSAVGSFSGNMTYGKGLRQDRIDRLKKEIETADAIVIGAGAGLSASAGFTYSGERFQKYFFDFEKKYGFHDMYSGGFYVTQVEPEVSWAYWARNIYINRYAAAPEPVYEKLLSLVRDKDYFVITTNVDHQLQRAGFEKKRLFYTQGDYGLFQTADGRNGKTYDNEEWVMSAMAAQGFVKDESGVFCVPDSGNISMRIPHELIPKSPDDGSDVTTNLRVDDSFVEDDGWHRASAAYADFLRRHEDLHVLYMELGVGMNTPVIIKYPFWQMTMANNNAVYSCINYGEAFAPAEIAKQSICIDGDIAEVLNEIKA